MKTSIVHSIASSFGLSDSTSAGALCLALLVGNAPTHKIISTFLTYKCMYSLSSLNKFKIAYLSH